MKRVLLPLVVALMLLGLVPFISAQESLGEVARQARRHKPAPSPGERVYDNDNLPGKGVVNTVGTASTDTSKPADQTDAQANGQAAGDDANKDKNATSSADDQKKKNDEWADKIAKQKDEVSRLERELNVLQREAQIHASVNAADLGSRLANNAKNAEADRKYQEDIAAKQKQVDDAKQKLADMQEEARKSGVPASKRD